MSVFVYSKVRKSVYKYDFEILSLYESGKIVIISINGLVNN